MGLADNIRKLRTDADLTQAKLAEMVGVTRATVTQWETGWSQPRMGAIEKLADVFGVSLATLVSEGSPSANSLNIKGAPMAKTYLSSMPFSYSGLIDQLQYDGFSLEDATYGADNCGADWMVQAEKSAKNYLDMMAFSHSGLVEQLMYEGYTAEEAEHGATSQGI